MYLLVVSLTAKMEEERQKHCDVVIMDFVDHYNNLTLKSVSALKFVLTSGVFRQGRLSKRVIVIQMWHLRAFFNL